MSSSQPSPPDAGKILDFLDKAYNAPEHPEHFDALMEATKTYFFGDDGRSLSADIERLTRFDNHLTPHIARIQTMLDEAGSAPPKTNTPVARLWIEPDGRILDGNKAAASFLKVDFPCKLKDLDLDYGSKERLREALATRTKVNDVDVLHLMTETTADAAVGLCRSIGTGDVRRLEVSLSHVLWTRPLTDLVAEALELTDAETDVLSGVLKGQSQAEIAERRGRSLETIKAQSKSILHKSGCTRMSDVARLAQSIAFLLNAAPQVQEKPHFPRPLEVPNILEMQGGRRLEYLTYGAKGGHPILYIHGSLLGPYFTDAFLQGLTDMGATLYAPSRPSFGGTSPAGNAGYEQTAVADLVALCKQEELENVLLLTEHGGVSHAYRGAVALGDKVKGLVMIGAGVPIDEDKHLPHMDRYTRVAAAAVKHAPSAMELVTRIAISTYRRLGYRRFLETYFKESPADLAALDDPEFYEVMIKGLEHLTAQGPKAFVIDGASQMADWHKDFDKAKARAFWLHAEDDPILPAEHLREWISSRTNHPVETVPVGGYNLIHLQAGRVLEILKTALAW